jgi:hypothetical protein
MVQSKASMDMRTMPKQRYFRAAQKEQSVEVFGMVVRADKPARKHAQRAKHIRKRKLRLKSCIGSAITMDKEMFWKVAHLINLHGGASLALVLSRIVKGDYFSGFRHLTQLTWASICCQIFYQEEKSCTVKSFGVSIRWINAHFLVYPARPCEKLEIYRRANEKLIWAVRMVAPQKQDCMSHKIVQGPQGLPFQGSLHSSALS